MSITEEEASPMVVLAYENKPIMDALTAALRADCAPGEFVIFRSPFRWLRIAEDGEHHVLNNCYEMFDLESVLNIANLKCRYSFEHAAIVERAP